MDLFYTELNKNMKHALEKNLRYRVVHRIDIVRDALRRLAALAREVAQVIGIGTVLVGRLRDGFIVFCDVLLHELQQAVRAFGEVADRARHAARQRLDFLGRLLRLFRELADFVGDDGEAASRFARARRLDGRIEREEVRLLGDVCNRVGNLADFRRALCERRNRLSRFRDRRGNLRHLADGAVDGALAVLRHGRDFLRRLCRFRRRLLEVRPALRHRRGGIVLISD